MFFFLKKVFITIVFIAAATSIMQDPQAFTVPGYPGTVLNLARSNRKLMIRVRIPWDVLPVPMAAGARPDRSQYTARIAAAAFVPWVTGSGPDQLLVPFASRNTASTIRCCSSP